MNTLENHVRKPWGEIKSICLLEQQHWCNIAVKKLSISIVCAIHSLHTAEISCGSLWYS